MNSLTPLFKRTATKEPSAELRQKILDGIAAERMKQVLFQRRLSLASVGISGIVLFLGVFSYGEAILQSDFWVLLMLLFSDLGSVLNALQDFLYSLLETLPILPVVALLVPLMVLFWSLGWYFSQREVPEHFSSSMLAH